MAFHKSRNAELTWTPQEDALLKQLAERWPNNWTLIADTFNSSRLTLTADRRSAADCYERWRTRLVGEDDARETRQQAQSPTTPMTTRGTKRSLSMAMSPNVSNANHNGESKKRRKHNVMYETMRKAAKKKEAALKANGN